MKIKWISSVLCIFLVACLSYFLYAHAKGVPDNLLVLICSFLCLTPVVVLTNGIRYTTYKLYLRQSILGGLFMSLGVLWHLGWGLFHLMNVYVYVFGSLCLLLLYLSLWGTLYKTTKK